MGTETLRKKIGYLFFKLFVFLCWNENKRVKELLDKDTAQNLGYYLFNKTNKFNSDK